MIIFPILIMSIEFMKGVLSPMGAKTSIKRIDITKGGMGCFHTNKITKLDKK